MGQEDQNDEGTGRVTRSDILDAEEIPEPVKRSLLKEYNLDGPDSETAGAKPPENQEAAPQDDPTGKNGQKETGEPASPADEEREDNSDNATWEQRYRTLYGINQDQKKQLRTQKDENAKLRDQIISLTERLTRLESNTPERSQTENGNGDPNAHKASDQPGEDLIGGLGEYLREKVPQLGFDEDDVADFGDDLVDKLGSGTTRMIEHAMAYVQENHVKRLQEKIAQLESQLAPIQQRETQNAVQSFQETVRERYPNVDATLESPEFEAFAARMNSRFGNRIADAIDAQDADEVLYILSLFDNWLADQGRSNDATGNPSNPSSQNNPSLQSQVGPSKSMLRNDTDRRAPSAKKQYTRRERLEQEQRAVELIAKGYEEEADAIQKELRAAEKEGRFLE